MTFALSRQMQRWRHTSLPLLRCTSPRLIGLRTTEYQSQIYSTLPRLSTSIRDDTSRSKVQHVSPLLQVQNAPISHLSDQTPEHAGDSLQLSKQSPHDPLSQSSKAAPLRRRRLYWRIQSRRNVQLLEGSGPLNDSRRGFWSPRVFTIKPIRPRYYKTMKRFKARRKLYTLSHYKSTQVFRQLRKTKLSSRARRAKLAFILWKRAVSRATDWMYRLALPTSSKPLKIISHLMLQKTIPEIREEWNRLIAGKRMTSRKLGVILLHTLKISREFTLLLLEAIFPCTRSRPPNYMIEDILCLTILRWHKINKDELSEWTAQEQLRAISRCLMVVLKPTPAGAIHIRYDATTILFQNLDANDLVPIYKLLTMQKYYLGTQSLLHLADRFAKMNTMEDKLRAVGILEYLVADPRRVFNINNPAGASVCTSILKIHGPTKYARPIELAQRLLALGLQPNALVYNDLIALMWRSSELKAAWAIYRQMTAQMEVRDCHTYTGLMLGSLRAADIESLDRAFVLALERELLEPKDWGAFLHIIWSWPASDHSYPVKIGINRPARFRLMLQAYYRVFDLEPLKCLIDIPRKAASQWLGSTVDTILSEGIYHLTEEGFVPIINRIPKLYRSGQRLKPTKYVLSLMASAYVRGLTEPFNVLEFYMHFDKLLKDGDPLVTDLTYNNPSIHNSIIKALSSFDMSRPVAYEVLGDMLEANGDAARQHERPKSSVPRPNEVTFNMAINALMFDGQIEEAENMLHVMRSQGIPPDAVTWTILVRGYARLQDVDGTVRSLQRMEQEGFQSDERTISAFNMLSAGNRELALSKMERVIEENRKTQLSQLSGESSSNYGTTSGGSDTTDAEVSDTVLDDLQREIEDDIFRGKSRPSFTGHRRKRRR